MLVLPSEIPSSICRAIQNALNSTILVRKLRIPPTILPSPCVFALLLALHSDCCDGWDWFVLLSLVCGLCPDKELSSYEHVSDSPKDGW